MNVIVGMECSRTIADAFERKGHYAVSVDLKPNSHPHHVQCDLFAYLHTKPGFFDLGIFHPACTYLSVSGYHWNYRRPERMLLTNEAITDFLRVTQLTMPKLCIENPVCIMSSRWRKPDQIVQPYMFGDDASKTTCLWLKNLPPLFPTRRISGRIVDGKERWSNQTDSGQNRLGPSPERAANRAITYAGIADAMAEQWGTL